MEATGIEPVLHIPTRDLRNDYSLDGLRDHFARRHHCLSPLLFPRYGDCAVASNDMAVARTKLPLLMPPGVVVPLDFIPAVNAYPAIDDPNLNVEDVILGLGV